MTVQWNSYPCLVLLVMTLAMVGCEADSPISIPPVTSQGSKDDDNVEFKVIHLPMPGAADYLLVDDVNRDGKDDVILTNHGHNISRVFLQEPKRHWRPGPMIDIVGFHPGEMIATPGSDNRPTYLLFAEGSNRLKLLAPNENNGLKLIAELGGSSPRAGAWFKWPGWGQGLAFTPFNNPRIVLIKEFDSATAEATGSVSLDFLPGFARAQQVEVADINGDEIDEILVANSVLSSVMLVRYPGADAPPTIETFWTFEQGGRARQIKTADIDLDGDVDIIVPDQTEQRGTSITALNLLINKQNQDWQLRVIPIPSPSRAEGGTPGIRSVDFGVDTDGFGYALAAGYQRLSLLKFPHSEQEKDPEIRQLSMPAKAAIPGTILKDLDGDGHLDAVFAGGFGQGQGGAIIYGPLWSQFAELESYDLSPPVSPQVDTIHSATK